MDSAEHSTRNSTRTTPSSSFGNGSEAGWVAPEYGVNPLGSRREYGFLSHRKVRFSRRCYYWNLQISSRVRYQCTFLAYSCCARGNVEAYMTTTFARTVAPGKRRREAEEPHGDGGLIEINTHEISPQKRARGSGATNGIMKAARSALVPAISLWPGPQEQKPQGDGCGAATPNAQGIHRRLLLGPSFQ
jgi:hypothetical protein